MKKIFLITLLVTIISNVFSQDAKKSSSEELQYYVNCTGKTEGTISKAEILAQKSLSINRRDVDAYRIASFKLTLIIKNIDPIEIENNKDGSLLPKMIQIIDGAPSGSKLLFEYIKVVDSKEANGKTLTSHALSFVIE